MSAILLTVPNDPEAAAAARHVRRDLAQLFAGQTHGEAEIRRVALPVRDGDALVDLLAAEGVRTMIEIGLGYGSSALAIGEALAKNGSRDTRHVIIDAHQDRFDNLGWEAVVSAGMGGACTLLEERSQLALPRLVAEGLVFDAAFVDGSHTFHNVFVDLYFLRELVRPRGLLVLDDCQWPSVATAARYFETNMRWRAESFRLPTRLQAFRLPERGDEPRFEEFKPFGPGPGR